jgi:hypothetical protein
MKAGVVLLILSGVLLGCSTVQCRTGSIGSSVRPLDVRAALLASAKKSDPDFPNGREMLLTHFSHIGQLLTSRGDIIYVADRRAVIAGMLAPRGENFVTFFDGQFHFLGKVRYLASRPLWCDGGRLYLSGDLDDASAGLSGNVIDVTDGYKSLRAYHVRAYGSSGGIDD